MSLYVNGRKQDITPYSALPVATSAYVGDMAYLDTGASSARQWYVCIESSSDSYMWRLVFDGDKETSYAKITGL